MQNKLNDSKIESNQTHFDSEIESSHFKQVSFSESAKDKTCIY